MAPSVDDPKNLNNFLALIGGHPLEEVLTYLDLITNLLTDP